MLMPGGSGLLPLQLRFFRLMEPMEGWGLGRRIRLRGFISLGEPHSLTHQVQVVKRFKFWPLTAIQHSLLITLPLRRLLVLVVMAPETRLSGLSLVQLLHSKHI